MKYRTFAKINEKVSLLGMGAMRFPEEKTEKLMKTTLCLS